MNRLAAPWQVIRLSVNAAGCDVAARVAETQYGVAVTIVLAELERMVGELRNELHGGGGVAVGALLKTIHDCARGLRTELDLPVDSTWGRALSAQRAQIADLLRAEIESAPGRVRRLLRARPSTEIRANSVLDPDEVAEAEALVAFVGNCRSFAGELAINKMTQRTFNEIQYNWGPEPVRCSMAYVTPARSTAASAKARSTPQYASAPRCSAWNTPRC